MNKQELQQGMKDALPFVLGYIPLGLAFGVLARDAGLSVFQTVSMSALCQTGAGQFIAVGMFKAGGSLMAIILTNLLVNLRYALFATSTVPYMKDRVSTPLAAAISCCLTDEVFAVSMNRYRNHPATASYSSALALSARLTWIASTLAGALLGNLITNTDRLGLNFALPAMYISLLIMLIRRKADLYAGIAGAVIALLAGSFIPSTMDNYSNIIAATLAGATLGVIFNERR